MEFPPWLTISWAVIRQVVDVGLLAYLIYKTYEVLVKTQAIQLVKGAVFMVLIYAGAFFLELQTLSWVLNILAPGLVIAMAIVFQPELRKIFMRLGQGSWFRAGLRPRQTQIDAALNAAEALAGQGRGALIVFARTVGLKNIVESGTRLDAVLSSTLIVTIFGFDGPLHDGAVIVQDGKILAAGCLLPLSDQRDIRQSFGTRHRAALGLSEEADAAVLVVSEETGAISLAYDSKLFYDLSSDQVHARLQRLLATGDGGGGGESEEASLAE